MYSRSGGVKESLRRPTLLPRAVLSTICSASNNCPRDLYPVQSSLHILGRTVPRSTGKSDPWGAKEALIPFLSFLRVFIFHVPGISRKIGSLHGIHPELLDVQLWHTWKRVLGGCLQAWEGTMYADHGQCFNDIPKPLKISEISTTCLGDNASSALECRIIVYVSFKPMREDGRRRHGDWHSVCKRASPCRVISHRRAPGPASYFLASFLWQSCNVEWTEIRRSGIAADRILRGRCRGGDRALPQRRGLRFSHLQPTMPWNIVEDASTGSQRFRIPGIIYYRSTIRLSSSVPACEFSRHRSWSSDPASCEISHGTARAPLLSARHAPLSHRAAPSSPRAAH